MKSNFKLLLNAELKRKKQDDDWMIMVLQNESSKYNKKPIQKSKNINRNRIEGHKIIKRQNFSKKGGYPAAVFCNCYRMNRRLFARIAKDIRNYDSYFVRKPERSFHMAHFVFVV